jgi:hypothetical protein
MALVATPHPAMMNASHDCIPIHVLIHDCLMTVFPSIHTSYPFPYTRLQAVLLLSGSSDKTVQLCSLAPLVPSPSSLTAPASPSTPSDTTKTRGTPSSPGGAGSSQGSQGQGGSSKVLAVLRGHESEVRGLCVIAQDSGVSGSGPALVSGGLDGRVKWW